MSTKRSQRAKRNIAATGIVSDHADLGSDLLQPTKRQAIKGSCMQLWELPDELLIRIVSFVEAPTLRAAVLCHQIAPLCKAAHQALFSTETVCQKQEGEEDNGKFMQSSSPSYSSSAFIWETLLQTDYDISDPNNRYHNHSPHHKSDPKTRPQRRSSQRLLRSSVQRVRDAHRRIKDNTEVAFFYVSELVRGCGGGNNILVGDGIDRHHHRRHHRHRHPHLHGGNNNNNNKWSTAQHLSKNRLCQILNDFGPLLRLNHVTATGGSFLVEICRARYVTETVILKCVQELIENRGAVMTDLASQESSQSTQTALFVAAVRGMPLVVQYLLRRGANPMLRSSGRFRLHYRPSKFMRGQDWTPYQFACAMKKAEMDAGATPSQVRQLDKCIQTLQSWQGQDHATNGTHIKVPKK